MEVDDIKFKNEGVSGTLQIWYDQYIFIKGIFKSQIIDDAGKYNIETPLKLVEKIRPHIKDLQSKYMKGIKGFYYNFHRSVFISDNLEEEEIMRFSDPEYLEEGEEYDRSEDIDHEAEIFFKPFSIRLEFNISYCPSYKEEELGKITIGEYEDDLLTTDGFIYKNRRHWNGRKKKDDCFHMCKAVDDFNIRKASNI